MLLFEHQTSGTAGPKGPNPGPRPPAKHAGRLFMLITMVPNMQLFLPIRCGCFSVYRELKNASWMPNFGFTIGVYVNIKQVSSLRTTDMTYICTGV